MTIMVSTGLWERSPFFWPCSTLSPRPPPLRVAALYLALFIAMLAAALLLVPGSLLGLVLGHSAGVADQVNLAWLATSIATLGGALGAALESSEKRLLEAAYAYPPLPRPTPSPACGDVRFTDSAAVPAHGCLLYAEVHRPFCAPVPTVCSTEFRDFPELCGFGQSVGKSE